MSEVAQITTKDVALVIVLMFGVHETVPPGVFVEMITLDVDNIFVFVIVIDPPDVQVNVPARPLVSVTLFVLTDPPYTLTAVAAKVA